MSKYSVDRIEEKTAVIEYNGKFFEIELDELPENINEGDVIVKDDNGNFIIDYSQTKKIQKELFEKQKSLFDC